MTFENEFTIVGIDGGGTHTRGILNRKGKIVAESKSGSSRIGSVGVGESCERLLHVIQDLCEKAEIESSEIDATVIGLAGVWLEEEKKRSRQLLKTLARTSDFVLNDIVVTSDAELALEGALGGSQGIILIVGTGSIGLARVGKKRIERCGGWGIELDDEGSGAWIGREGLTSVVRALDGRGMATKLTDILSEMYSTINIDEPRTIVKAYSERTFEYHMLTPAVMKCADEGDKVCLEIINRAAFHLMEILEVLAKNYDLKKVPVACMGGIIENDTLLSKMLEERIESSDKLKLLKPKGFALDGAISIGKRLIKEME